MVYYGLQGALPGITTEQGEGVIPLSPLIKTNPGASLDFYLREDADVSSDPCCLNNLAGNPEYSEVEAELKEELMKVLTESKDPRVLQLSHPYIPVTDQVCVVLEL